jgi:thiol:disulfide interchange protein DsbC
MLNKNGILTIVLWSISVNWAVAAEPGVEAVKKSLRSVLPDTKPSSISPSVIPGVYEVVLDSEVVYVSENGRYLLQGNLIDLQEQENLTEARRARLRKTALEGVDEASMIVFSPEHVKHTVTVFTDIDCGYCRKLHSEIDEYNHRGIKIRYMAYPRAGMHSPSYRKAVSVWCADDRKQAITDAKKGKAVTPKTCPNPVAEHMALGAKLGVSGTPALVLDDGTLLPGYLSPLKLSRILEAHSTP